MKNFFGNFLARRRQAGTTGTPPKPPKCPFPNCGADIVPMPGNDVEACEYHRKLVLDVAYILARLRPVEVKPKGPHIVIPGARIINPPTKGG